MIYGVLTGVSVSHDWATVGEIDAVHPFDQQEAVRHLCSVEEVSEVFVLQTCNRSEAYVVTSDPDTGRTILTDFITDVDDSCLVWMDHEESIRHLLRVASGLESQVLGEDHVLGQVKTAYENAQDAGAIGMLLEGALTKAIRVGKQARAETAINEGVTSLGGATVEFAAQEFDLSSITVLVVGAGEMGTNTAKAFARRGVDQIVVANRTFAHAEALVDKLAVDARSGELSDLPTAIEEADVVATATGSTDTVLSKETFAKSGETVVIDLARPRDVAPEVAALEKVTVYDLDDLETVTEQIYQDRRTAADQVDSMIDRELEQLLAQFKRKQADDVITAIYKNADQIKQRELQRAITKLEAQGEVTPAQRETIEALADAVTNKLLSSPADSLRRAASADNWTTINTALRLFDPEYDVESGGEDETPSTTTTANKDENPWHLLTDAERV